MDGAGIILSVALVFAAAAGLGLAAAARALVRRAEAGDYDFTAGYNALAPILVD